MTTKNRYFRRSKISEAKFRQIVRHFALDLSWFNFSGQFLKCPGDLPWPRKPHHRLAPLTAL